MAPITLDGIHRLPDNLDVAEIDRTAGEFLRGLAGDHARADVAGALFDARVAIVEWILRCWDDADVEVSENILGIVAFLGLHEARHRMAESAAHSPQAYLREQFAEYLATLGDPPWDPYKGY